MDAEPPPSYAQATGSSNTSNSNNPTSPTHQSTRPDASAYLHENPEGDERSLPEGWIRQYDAQQAHSYFVDTNSEPPRSIWVHPYEDETYLKSLTSEQRERIQEEDAAREKRVKAKKSKKAEAGMDDESASDDEKRLKTAGASASTSRPMSSGAGPSNLASSSSQPTGAKKYGRKFMDKLTGMTHEERKAEKAKRREEERQAYEASMAMRSAINRAVLTGQPQRVGRDKQGHSVYVEPPPQPGFNYGGYGAPNGLNNRGFGYSAPSPAMVAGNPIYGDPNARFVRPSYGYGYNRPYGPGRGGMGMPLAGGLLGGMLLGGLLF